MGNSAEVRSRAAGIRLVCLDIDGVFTDGSLYYGRDGEALKRYHVRDGLGVRMLQHHQVEVAVISARASELVGRRMTDLKIRHWFIGRDDKSIALDELCERVAVTPEQVAYLGDDLLDVPVMRRVGLAVAVRDAHPYLESVAHLRTEALGGAGAIRELADLILDARFGLGVAYERFLAEGLAQTSLEKA